MQETLVVEWESETGMGKQPVKSVSSSQLAQWAVELAPIKGSRDQREQCFCEYLGERPGDLVALLNHCTWILRQKYNENVTVMSNFYRSS